MKLVWLSLPLVLNAIRSAAVLYRSIQTLPTTIYDFIIVGGQPNTISEINQDYLRLFPGGTAGNVIANRLTENPKWKVLVVESGPS